MSWLESLPGDAMTFEFGQTVHRIRPKLVWNEYSKKYVAGDWTDPDELPIEDAFVAQSSTSLLRTETRDQAAESKSLFCDGDADVRKGDRIRVGGPGGPTYTIDGIPPAADSNPFTGWTPPREIPLTRFVG
ncbi:hypothetical protein [Microbacterium sp. PAMC21962]|uniref:hypothetical protein n=1 Tax=Microbacterium sp. PAMC21962 TaxID=2861280 RepID=UPI001C633943|nr:hypothetical protein [Microbacterium sp. PAMC21962]QYF98911.1 hypothetical protein KY498_06775 [Microbacterium sp. PAMC21962]